MEVVCILQEASQLSKLQYYKIEKKKNWLCVEEPVFAKLGANNPITLSVVPSAKKSEQKLSIAHKIK